jgi:sulfide:quinone oxidoreductase
VDPSGKHYHQPAWTLVGAGILISKKLSVMKRSYSKKTPWIKDAVSAFELLNLQLNVFLELKSLMIT